jgi:hypothetical protein
MLATIPGFIDLAAVAHPNAQLSEMRITHWTVLNFALDVPAL